jgi:hypothetical protein
MKLHLPHPLPPSESQVKEQVPQLLPLLLLVIAKTSLPTPQRHRRLESTNTADTKISQVISAARSAHEVPHELMYVKRARPVYDVPRLVTAAPSQASTAARLRSDPGVSVAGPAPKHRGRAFSLLCPCRPLSP